MVVLASRFFFLYGHRRLLMEVIPAQLSESPGQNYQGNTWAEGKEKVKALMDPKPVFFKVGNWAPWRGGIQER